MYVEALGRLGRVITRSCGLVSFVKSQNDLVLGRPCGISVRSLGRVPVESWSGLCVRSAECWVGKVRSARLGRRRLRDGRDKGFSSL